MANDLRIASDLRISRQNNFFVSESDIRVNYNDTSKIIAASNTQRGSAGQTQYYSSDGGASWAQTNLPIVLDDVIHSDPTVDWTSDGTAWATTIGITIDDAILRLRSYRSNDFGQTWNFESTISGDHTAADREMMWVDHSPTSLFKDNIYVIWHNGPATFVNRRTGPSGSWQTPIRVSGVETRAALGNDIKTNSSGDVFAFWPDTISRNLFVAKSINGGAIFSAPVTIATTFDSFNIRIPSFDYRRVSIYITGGAYRTPAKNLVFAVWTDLTGAAGCNSSINEPGTNVSSACKTRIWFSRSTNGGAIWQTPIMINNQASLNDQFNPWLAVDETNGVLVVIYYDTVNDAGRLKTDVWAQTSHDDGATWSTAERVTTAQTDETVSGANTNPGNQYGDYNGLSGYAGRFFPSWTDRRSSMREEIWTAKILVNNIKTLLVKIDTLNQPGADTGGDVFLGIGGREFNIDSRKNNFEKNAKELFILGEIPNPRPVGSMEVIHKDRNNPKDPLPLNTDDLDKYPVYLRFEPLKYNATEEWGLDYAYVRVNPSGEDNQEVLYEALKPPNVFLWLGRHGGRYCYLHKVET